MLASLPRYEVPPLRIRRLNERPPRPDGQLVLYWMIGFRRTSWNFSLDRALWWSRELRRPLLVLEALRCDYRWASDRLHGFVIDGMRDNAAALGEHGVRYHPYVEPKKNAGRGLLAALADRAAVVVTDDFPTFFLPAMLRAAAGQVPVQFEAVDSNGLLPLRAADKVFARAYDFRRFLQRALPPYLDQMPQRDPLAGYRGGPATIPRDILDRWPAATKKGLDRGAAERAELPIDHQVAPSIYTGGQQAGAVRLNRFLNDRLVAYDQQRNDPDYQATSSLSAYLHFGHVSPHAVFSGIAEAEHWQRSHLSEESRGSRGGWWGMSPSSEAFLDQLVTWRELGLNMSWQRDDYDRYHSLPQWAQATLDQHRADRRSYLYWLEQFEAAATHEPLWNAAQRQLVREGRLHNYMRMLWGKKILHWSESPEAALEIMIELNNKYAVDGRDPNSYSGIGWVLGRYDRPWGPERPIFGKIRYMSCDNARRKLKLDDYLAKYGEQD